MNFDGFVKSSPAKAGQGAQKLRRAAHLQVRRYGEVEAQSRSERDRWTFYETIFIVPGAHLREGLSEGWQGKGGFMTREQIYEFFSRFDGPEGCSTRSICMLSAIHLKIRDANGSLSWECPGDRSKTLSRQILDKMGVKGKEQIRFLSLLDLYEGSCECEILCNILEEEDGVKNFADDFLGIKSPN